MDELMVVVQMVTYNHEKYVEQAIESVMMQQTSFRYKLIIAEDCSTDHTREICIALKNKYPEKIELLLNSKNLGVKQNAIQVHKACMGSAARYVAICEGDDYWTDALKLQRQVDYLEQHINCSLIMSNAKIFEDNSFWETPLVKTRESRNYNMNALMEIGNIASSSMLYKKRLYNPVFFDALINSKYGDILLIATALTIGYVRYENEFNSVYRYGHPSSVTFNEISEEIWLDNWLCAAAKLWRAQKSNENKRSLANYISIKYQALANLNLKNRRYLAMVVNSFRSAYYLPTKSFREFKDGYYRIFRY